MSDATKAPKLDLDEALKALRGGPAGDEQNDERARAILAAVTGEAAPSAADLTRLTDDDLFAAPLPRAEGEPDRVQTARTRDRDRKELQELARLAAQTEKAAPEPAPRARREEDSGIVDLAAASKADPHAEVRAKTTPLANEDLFAVAAAAEAPSIVDGPKERASKSDGPKERASKSDHPNERASKSDAPKVAARTPVTALSTEPTAERASRAPRAADPSRRAPRIATVAIGIAAMAAGVFFFLRPPPPPATTGAEPGAPVAAQPAPPPAIAPPAKDEPPATDPNALPTAVAHATPPAPQHATAAPPHAAPAGGGGGAAAKPAGEAPTATPTAGSPEDLAAALDREVGGRKLQPAAAVSGPSGGRPDRPSQGAVNGAIGAVLGEARTCLGPDDPISRASIVFGSDGSVQSVTITGGAAGKPAEACVKAALSKAKVQPFLEPSFTASITVRHP